MKTILTRCSIIDCYNSQPSIPHNILIENGIIKAVTTEELGDSNDALTIDMDGLYVLPGLIDNHVHVIAAQFDLANLTLPPEIITLRAANFLEDMLNRGFTSVRDAGGASNGLAEAIRQGLIKGPRLFPSILALSQTGGHGDFNYKTQEDDIHFCHGGNSSISVIADGVSSIRKMAREQLRQGATQIKIMASGGVASPSDNVNNIQFSEEEVRAVVEEAQNADTYVMAHAYAPSAIRHCVTNGVKSIEHGNLIDEETAELVAKHNAYVVPTVVIYHAIAKIGLQEGFPKASVEKVQGVLDNCLKAIEISRAQNVKLGFGTDLLGPKAQMFQSEEFKIRANGSETPHQVICSATNVNAEILQQHNKLGVIKENALADIIAVKGNPLDDISFLCDQGKHLALIMKDGKIHKNTIDHE